MIIIISERNKVLKKKDTKQKKKPTYTSEAIMFFVCFDLFILLESMSHYQKNLRRKNERRYDNDDKCKCRIGLKPIESA